MTKIKLNGFQIKVFMAILMVFDHLPYIRGFVPQNWVGIFHVITRVVSVWFAYCAVEGFLYSKNRKQYTGRLFFWAFVMFGGNTLINFAFQAKEISIHNNIFLTLAVGVLMLGCIKTIQNKLLKWAVVIVILVCGGMTEGGMIILPFMLMTYLTYGKAKVRNICYLVFSFLLFITAFQNYGDLATTLDMLAYNSDFMFITIIPVLYLYNGERGSSSKFAKYFFYVFYPLHLWIITAVAWFW